MEIKQQSPSELIEELIRHWVDWEAHENYYLTKLAPCLVVNPESGDGKEKTILDALRQQLNDQEWQNLPKLISEKRSGHLREIESERLEKEALEKKRRVEARIKAQEQKELEKKRRVEARIKAQEQKELEKKKQEKFRIEAQREEALKKKRLEDARIAARLEKQKQVQLQEIRKQFEADFLDTHYLKNDIITQKEFETEKLSFVKSWVANHISGTEPDDEQAAAIAAVQGHTQVIARAGSGKTTTLVSHALFLMKHCGVDSNQILILTFNKAASLEVRKRLFTLQMESAAAADKAIDDYNKQQRSNSGRQRSSKGYDENKVISAIASRLNMDLPYVMTFHALAHAIVHPKEYIISNGPEDNNQTLDKVVQEMIDDQLQEAEFQEQIRELMLAYFQGTWERIVAGRYDKSKEELLQYRRSLEGESMNGDKIKSYGEKVIANFLFEHDIPYKYERSYSWSGINYRPDFTIFKTTNSNVIIEYFGLKGDADYDEMSVAKRAFWKSKKDGTLIEFSPVDIAKDAGNSFPDLLKTRLEEQGVPCVRLSEDEIWNRIKDRAIDRFTQAAQSFIGRCRKYSLSPSKLQSRIENYSPSYEVEKMFLNILNPLYSAYLDRLSMTGKEDFDGLMQRAIQEIGSGQTDFKRVSEQGNLAGLLHICIDEYQDFSNLFHQMIGAIRERNPEVQLFCVGDDWQAINGFAGSDLRFFQNFDDHVGESHRVYLSTNYRSSDAVVTLGNQLMEGLGKPAVAHKQLPGEVLVLDTKNFSPSFTEQKHHSYDIITPIVIRLVNNALTNDMDLVMLCRTNTLPWYVHYQDKKTSGRREFSKYLNYVRSFFPKDQQGRISISTAHKYKGKEQSMVIIMDALVRSYPLIHPSWIFLQIFDDTPKKIIEEERRLLYVAFTRAINKLVIITEGEKKSSFLDELECQLPIKAINWDDYKYPRKQAPRSRLIVWVGNQKGRGSNPTFAIKHLLQADQFDWWQKGDLGPGWRKYFSAKEFNIEALKSRAWAKAADEVDLRILDENEDIVAQFLINSGNWQCEVNRLDEV